jgi:hypothetical protein
MLPHTPDGHGMAWHGMAADSSHCILACFTVQAKTWPQCWAGAAGCSQQSYCMLFDWGSEGSRLQHPRHTCGCWLNLTDHHLFEQMLTWSYVGLKNEQRWKGSTSAMCSAFVAMMVPWSWMDGWIGPMHMRSTSLLPLNPDRTEHQWAVALLYSCYFIRQKTGDFFFLNKKR